MHMNQGPKLTAALSRINYFISNQFGMPYFRLSMQSCQP